MPYNYNPWTDAAGAAQSIGQSAQLIPLQMARAHAMQQQMMMEAALRDAQIQHYGAQSQYQNAQTAHQQAVDQAAQALGQSVYAQQEPPVATMDFPSPGASPMFGVSGPVQNTRGLNNASVMRDMALVAALAGNPQRAFPSVAMNPGQQRINPVTGQVIGSVPESPALRFAPAGSTPFMQQGSTATQAGPQTGFRPGANGEAGGLNRFSPVAALNAVEPTIAFGLQHPGLQSPTNSFFPQWQQATNIQALANRAIQAGLGQTNSPGAASAAPAQRRYRYDPATGTFTPTQ